MGCNHTKNIILSNMETANEIAMIFHKKGLCENVRIINLNHVVSVYFSYLTSIMILFLLVMHGYNNKAKKISTVLGM